MPINFRSKLQVALLAHYFSKPNAEYYLRELARTLSFNAAYLSRTLSALSNFGLFISTKRDREKYFRLNRNHPLYNELKMITKYVVAKKDTIRK